MSVGLLLDEQAFGAIVSDDPSGASVLSRSRSPGDVMSESALRLTPVTFIDHAQLVVCSAAVDQDVFITSGAARTVRPRRTDR
jgi:hypothetical protein